MQYYPAIQQSIEMTARELNNKSKIVTKSKGVIDAERT